MTRKIFKGKTIIHEKDLRGLRKHIYNLDTSLEAIMDVISKNDKGIYENVSKSKEGEYMSRIAYAHKEEWNLMKNKSKDS
nr:MAG: hypothetical protein CM15mV30_1170 [uncultured marine virus]